MLLAATPTAGLVDSDESRDVVRVDCAQVPYAFARMVVQIPCRYTACARGSVSAGSTTLLLDSPSAELLQYVFSYSPATMHVHAPAHGCSAFLVYDVVCFDETMPEPAAAGDNRAGTHVAEAQRECREEEEGPTTGTVAGEEGAFSCRIVRPGPGAVVAGSLMTCAELEAACAGKGCLCVCVCMCTCTCVCKILQTLWKD
jgi:hypothetical protein